jgi:hypothetical protein
MKIKTISEADSESFKVYRVDTKNKAIIDKEFDAFHAAEKIK